MNGNKKIGLLMMTPYFLLQTGMMVASIFVDMYLDGHSTNLELAINAGEFGLSLTQIWSSGQFLWAIGWYGGFLVLVVGIYQGWKNR